MNKFPYIARFIMLLAALCFGLSIAATALYSADKQAAADSQSASVEHATDAAHGEADAHAEEGDHGGGHGEGLSLIHISEPTRR